MGEVLEYTPVFAHMCVEHGFATVLVAAPQNVVVGSRYDLNGIELDESQAID